MAKTIIYKAGTRGHTNHGWLDTYHTFSFADYYDDSRVHFGALRVLNDDSVAGGMGFGAHPHDNMEIISIPTEGDLEHRDSMGNIQVIKSGDIQVMSAGTGIQHSEKNKNHDKPVKFFQIWVFPRQRNVTPRYGQITLNPADRKNKLQQIVSPNEKDGATWINQDAWFQLGSFDNGKQAEYTLKNKNNGVYAFVIEGDFTVNGEKLNRRDGMGITETDKVALTANSDKAEILLMEVPMR
jgi:redox-sensitive bicupin YhaK (pirin superfamily)